LAHEIGVSSAHSAQGQASAGLDADTGGTVMIEILLRFGYVALFLGTFLEGETILLVAAFLAHRGYFNIYWVTSVAALGTMFGDQLFYFIGRKHGITFLDRRP
jgi:membrane protein DedA with SNARE-associated domain